MRDVLKATVSTIAGTCMLVTVISLLVEHGLQPESAFWFGVGYLVVAVVSYFMGVLD